MKKLEASIITTYRCINKCRMCHIWKYPTRKEEEFKPSLLHKLPALAFCNITGGEPFLREDIEEIIGILRQKAGRIVISTNGYFTQKILSAVSAYPDIGIRISLEAVGEKNDEMRGLQGCYQRGMRTLKKLKKIGCRDIGIAVTLSDDNADDLMKLYRIAEDLEVEFATAAVHNSYYFHKEDNRIQNPMQVSQNLKHLIRAQLKSKKIKNWYRAYFNRGLIDYVHGKPRPLPCRAGTDLFFLDPWGEVRPCNGMQEGKWMESMGSLHQHSFEHIWKSPQASKVRELVDHCRNNCWMIGTAGPAMKKNLTKPTIWVIKHKIRTNINSGT